MRDLPIVQLATWLWLGVLGVGCHDAGSTSTAQAVDLVQPALASVTSATPRPQCGRSGLPDCPLQNWMKSTLQAYQRANDFARLGRALAELSEHAPNDYRHWQDIAVRAQHAALAKDASALRQACKQCHDEYRARYRSERRTAEIW